MPMPQQIGSANSHAWHRAKLNPAKLTAAGDARRILAAPDASKSQVEYVENTVLVDVMALCWRRIRGHDGYLRQNSDEVFLNK